MCVPAAPAATPKEPEPMEVDVPSVAESSPSAAAAPVAVAPTAAAEAPVAAPVKKKKKKANYKNLMAGMMKSSPERDVEKEKEQLRKVTGGGAFSKIDKI